MTGDAGQEARRFGHPKRKVREAIIVLGLSAAAPVVPLVFTIGVLLLLGYGISPFDVGRIGPIHAVLGGTLWLALIAGNVLLAQRVLPTYVITEGGVSKSILGYYCRTLSWNEILRIEQVAETVFENWRAADQPVLVVSSRRNQQYSLVAETRLLATSHVARGHRSRTRVSGRCSARRLAAPGETR